MPVKGVSLHISYFPHQIKADLSTLLIQTEKQLHRSNIEREWPSIRKEMLLNYRNTIQGLTPVRTGRLRRSIRISYGEGTIATNVGYGPVQELGKLGMAGKHFFGRGIVLATAFNRSILAMHNTQDMIKQLDSRPDALKSSEMRRSIADLKKTSTRLKAITSLRTRARSKLPSEDFFRRVDTIQLLAEGNSRAAFITNTVSSFARSLGPAGLAIGPFRFLNRNQVRRNANQISAINQHGGPIIDPSDKARLQSLQAEAARIVDTELLPQHGLSAPSGGRYRSAAIGQKEQRAEVRRQELEDAREAREPEPEPTPRTRRTSRKRRRK